MTNSLRIQSQSLPDAQSLLGEASGLDLAGAEAVLTDLARVFFQGSSLPDALPEAVDEPESPNVDARYRALVEQLPAVVFMAYLDKGIGEAYVSPQIEESLGFSQSEWLEDPVRWYQQIHPGDKQRWSLEAAQMFLSGKPLKSAYRVLARNGRVIWFHCEAKMIRRSDGRPWFIHGVAFDITELKRTEEALEEERNVLSALLDTVGALVVVLDPAGRIVRFNRACEQTTGFLFEEVKGKHIWDLFLAPEEQDRFRTMFDQSRTGLATDNYESYWMTRNGGSRLIGWSTTVLPRVDNTVRYVIATGIDITERRRLEGAILEISGREQRRIGQDLHDGLGQHLTGIAFMSKALEQKLAQKSLPEAADAAKIVRLVNEAIHKTRELARGLLPVLSESQGLMSALQQWASEVEDLFQISCRFDCADPVLVPDDAVATHLYHIAQEAVHNAIKHGKAKNIRIGLAARNDEGFLTVKDDGLGISAIPAGQTGMGLDIMNYRARTIRGSLTIARCGDYGTLVTCTFPIDKRGGIR
jgi:PAS domain S-box-containing protein